MSDKVLHISDADFENEVLKSDRPVLVDFWAPWCGPCKMVGPIVEELAGELENVKFCKIDIDENSAWASKLNIMSIPSLLMYKGGEVVAKQVGAVPKEELKNFITSHI